MASLSAGGRLALHPRELSSPAGSGRLGNLDDAEDLGQVLALAEHTLALTDLAEGLRGAASVALQAACILPLWDQMLTSSDRQSPRHCLGAEKEEGSAGECFLGP